MLHQLVPGAVVTETIVEVSDVLGEDVLSLDTAEAQRSTVSTQLGLLTASVATARMLLEQGAEPTVVLGMSVGAFSAAVLADSITLRDALLLVKDRAERMQALFPEGYGMAAILGLSEVQVEQIVQAVSSDAAPVFVTNINAERQIVTSGAQAGLAEVMKRATALGAQKADLLNVSVPSHCRLLEPVAVALTKQLESLSIRSPRYTYISNVQARAIYTAQGVGADLANNIAHGVRWFDATEVAAELGCDLFLEMTPGHSLTDLLRQSHPSVEAIPVTTATLSRCLRKAAST
jgi:malonate decarboxylase epsilon subunit